MSQFGFKNDAILDFAKYIYKYLDKGEKSSVFLILLRHLITSTS